MRPLHPKAIEAFEEWRGSLPLGVRLDSTQWRQMLGLGLTGAVEWVCAKPPGYGPGGWWIQPDQHPAIVRRIRRGALEDIAGHEPTEEDRSAAVRARFGEYYTFSCVESCKRSCFWLLWAHVGWIEALLTRRRRAAQRLLVADDAAEQAEQTPAEAWDRLAWERVEVGT